MHTGAYMKQETVQVRVNKSDYELLKSLSYSDIGKVPITTLVADLIKEFIRVRSERDNV